MVEHPHVGSAVAVPVSDYWNRGGRAKPDDFVDTSHRIGQIPQARCEHSSFRGPSTIPITNHRDLAWLSEADHLGDTPSVIGQEPQVAIKDTDLGTGDQRG